MTSGVTYPTFDRIVREVFVEVAERDLALPFKRQTDSRVTLLTGINRKEVAQLRMHGEKRAAHAEPEDSTLTHLIGRWMAGPPYATPDGVARRLPYDAASPRVPSFSRLARDVVGGDIPVRSVLDELLHRGVAKLLPNGDIELQEEVNALPADAEGKMLLLGSDPAELFRTIVHNIEEPESSWLQRKVVYDNIGGEALDQLKAEARRIGEEFVRRANALLASYDRDRHPDAAGGARCRVVLGAYYFDEPAAEPEPETAGVGKPKRPRGRVRRSR